MVVHVGYHKTATTWLQSIVFPNWPGVALQNPHFDRPWDDKFLRAVIREHDDQWDPAAVRAHLQAPAGKELVISAEDLSGIPVAGVLGFRSARRLHEAVPDAKILLVIRNQIDTIESIWKQYVRMGWSGTLDEMLAERSMWYNATFDLSHWDYDALIGYYQRLFGKDRVTVLTFEALRADRQQWLSDLAVCIGRPPPASISDERANPSLSFAEAHMLARANRVLSSQVDPHGLIRFTSRGGRLLRRVALAAAASNPQRSMADRHVQAIARRYEASNERLAKLLPNGALGGFLERIRKRSQAA